MTEEEFLERWHRERPIYEAWGNFVVERIRDKLCGKISPMSVDLFVRIPPKTRLKEDTSLIEKAFYRKDYDNPYDDITDKIGARFVVLLVRDLDAINSVIAECPEWNASKDRDFEAEQELDPIQFAYAAVHYVVYCKNDLIFDSVPIPARTACEVQVKTILQHAYSELAHDTIYKPKVDATPFTLRAAAKSMALIEATNDYFETVVDQVNMVTAPERKLTEALSPIYNQLTRLAPALTRIEGLILDALPNVDADIARGQVEKMTAERSYLGERIADRSRTKLMYRQPSILLVYLHAIDAPTELKGLWPLTPDELRPIYSDLGLAFDSF